MELRPAQVPRRSPFKSEGLAALLHAIAHIEFNAINLALDAAWRFDGMPPAFYRDWVRVAAEEAYHFSLVREHLSSLGYGVLARRATRRHAFIRRSTSKREGKQASAARSLP